MRKPANEGWTAPPNTPADTSSKINSQSHHTSRHAALDLVCRHFLKGFLKCGFAVDHHLQTAIPKCPHPRFYR